MMKKWKLRGSIPKEIDQSLKQYPELVRKLLFYRGFETGEEAERFLHPDYERDLLDPFLMEGMAKAVERFLKAIEHKEKIIIFGDYDADGVPGAAILAIFLEKIGFTNFEIYIPDRNNEAYGLSLETVKDFAQKKVGLIITVDCGITDVSEVELANELGIDVVVTDHHLVPEELPPAYAIVDAKQKEDKYPEKMLAGSGVAYKFICATLAKKRFDIPVGWEKWLLDLVAIATVSDMVPMTGENRLLTYYGLKVFRQTKRLGLISLLNIIKTKPINITEDDISFMIGPRLNSASRMSHASQAYYLLTTRDEVVAVTIAKHLEDKNKERREAVERVIKEVDKMIDVDNLSPVIVAGSADWGLGMLGLTSSRLVEKYGRPVWLWSKNLNGTIKGSCRSDGSVNLVEVMERAGGKNFFLDFGGHVMAGGFSLEPEKIEELGSRLINAFNQAERREVAEEILVDGYLLLDQVNWETYKLVEPFAPFGVDNPKPIFWLSGVEIFSAKSFGNGGLHLEIVFRKQNGDKISAIGFFACAPRSFSEVEPMVDSLNHIFGDLKLGKGEKIEALVTLERSTFKNYPELRLRIVDLKKSA